MCERVLAHLARDAATCRVSGGDVATIADVLPAAALVGADEICADDCALIFSDEDLLFGCEPEGQGLILRHVSLERIGFAGPDDRLKDGPDGWGVVCGSGANVHGAMISIAPNAESEKVRSFSTIISVAWRQWL